LYKKILIPLDGSEMSDDVFNYAGNVTRGLKGLESVTLLHVYGQDERGTVPMHRAYIEHAAEVIRNKAQKPNKAAGEVEVKVRGELVMGKPADEIVSFAEENGIDLIIMGTHGRSGVNRWAMGSVAYKVVRGVKIPIWLVKHGVSPDILEGRLPQKKILVPLDGSKAGEQVLPYVETLAEQWEDGEAEIILMQTCEPPAISSDYPSDMPVSWEEHVEIETAKCKVTAGPYLLKLEKRLHEAGFKARREVPAGKPAEEIIRYAEKNQVNLIAMMTHGRSGISRWVYGSVAEEVMMGAHVPVLLAKPRVFDEG
jgi:nucleotide-binding universal stress UspA family protein